jgi:predicted transcriptional regulator
MGQLKIDPFVSEEPEVELDPEIRRLLRERMKSADQGRLVSAEEARRHVQQWLSNSATTKTR